MPVPPVACVELVEKVTDWMDGALTEDDRTHVEEHIAVCRHCARYVSQLRRSIEVLHELPHEAPPPAARAALLDAFRRSETD